MANYVVNKNAQANGDHEVHVTTCSRVPAAHNQQRLGNYSSCRPAVQAARKYYSQVDGCYYCANACHKR